MPKSRHRKNHKKKVKSFKQKALAAKQAEIKEYKEKMEEVYKKAQDAQTQGKGVKPVETKPLKIESGAVSSTDKGGDNNLNKIKI
jgi:uncharacterized protein (DUF305 family)